MKNFKFYTVLLLAIFTFNSVNAFKLKVKGSGGVETDGNNHKICPTKTKDVCAIIEITWKDIFKTLIEPDNPNPIIKFNDVEILVYKENGLTESFTNVNCTLEETKVISQSDKDMIIESNVRF